MRGVDSLNRQVRGVFTSQNCVLCVSAWLPLRQTQVPLSMALTLVVAKILYLTLYMVFGSSAMLSAQLYTLRFQAL